MGDREMSAKTQKKATCSAGQPAAAEPEVFVYEGGQVAEELLRSLTRVRVGQQVTEIPPGAFLGCDRLIELQLNEGLKVIGERAFEDCSSLRSVTVPSTVTKLGWDAFKSCNSLIKLQLREGLKVIGEGAFYLCTALRSVTLPSSLTALSWAAFRGCVNLAKVCLSKRLRIIPGEAFRDCVKLTGLQLNEGLQIIGQCAFDGCKSLQSVTLPSSVTELGVDAFADCTGLIKLHLNEGLRVIGFRAFADCTALRSVTIPSTVTKLGIYSFAGCSNLSEVVFQSGKRLLNQEFVHCGYHREEQLLDREALDEMLFEEMHDGRMGFAFRGCSVTTLKISISWAVNERMARLPRQCKVSVERRIRNLRRLRLLQDGNVLACIPVVRMAPGVEAEDESEDEAENVTYKVRDSNHETARSLYQVLQLIAFHELKESSIAIELAMWKSRIDEGTRFSRAECRDPIPDPAKSLIMEYGGFAGFLEPVIEGA